MPEIADVLPGDARRTAAITRFEPGTSRPQAPDATPSGPGEGSRIDPALWRALRRAAGHVGDELAPPAAADAARSDVPVLLERLCLDIRRAVRDDSAPIADYPSGMRMRPLIDALRTALLTELQEVSTSVSPRDVVELLRGLEYVQSALRQDVTQRFTDRLAERDAPALVVEVAHDMRSPLTSILFLVETLRNGQSGPLTPIQDRQLGLVYSAAFGLSSLTNDVIDLARGGDRLVDAQPIQFSLRETFNSVRDIVLPIAAEKGLALRLVSPEADLRLGYPAALNRVLLNLTTNALKFTREGYVEVTGRQVSRTAIEFSVTDTGQGIPPHVMQSLCEAFRPTENSGTDVFSSAGLGLAICQKLVRAMGSALRAESTPNVGSRFFFTLDLPLPPRL